MHYLHHRDRAVLFKLFLVRGGGGDLDTVETGYMCNALYILYVYCVQYSICTRLASFPGSRAWGQEPAQEWGCATEAFSTSCAVHIEDCEDWWLFSWCVSVAESALATQAEGVLGSNHGNCLIMPYINALLDANANRELWNHHQLYRHWNFQPLQNCQVDDGEQGSEVNRFVLHATLRCSKSHYLSVEPNPCYHRTDNTNDIHENRQPNNADECYTDSKISIE